MKGRWGGLLGTPKGPGLLELSEKGYSTGGFLVDIPLGPRACSMYLLSPRALSYEMRFKK